MSHQTHYRSHRAIGDGFLRVKWPNQQRKSIEGRFLQPTSAFVFHILLCHFSFHYTSRRQH